MGGFGNQVASRLERRIYVKKTKLLVISTIITLILLACCYFDTSFFAYLNNTKNAAEDVEGKVFLTANIISQNENYLFFSPDTMKAEGNTNISLKDIISENSNILMTYEGGYYKIINTGILSVENNQINYIDNEKNILYEKVAGIIVDPPSLSIMDVYNDSINFITNNQKVLVIYVDGLSFEQYNYAISNNLTPFISTLPNALPALSVYKPVTNSGFAAMLTGQPPYKNGILDRSYREPQIETIFDYLSSIEKKSILIEGNINILSLNTDVILNIDTDKDGYTDNEVFNSAMNKMHNIDFCLVHFHGLDDAGHTYGPFAEKTMAKLTEIDNYIETLVDNWTGKVIITSDHGMHKTEEGGNHGDFRYEDLIVPYLLTEGGKNQ
jgi:hypothetical protein